MEIKRIWLDRDGQIVLWQWPNIWLVVWLIAAVTSHILRSGKAQETVHWLGTGSLVIWSLLEIFRGVNYFRRGLGLVVLAVTVASTLLPIL